MSDKLKKTNRKLQSGVPTKVLIQRSNQNMIAAANLKTQSNFNMAQKQALNIIRQS